MPDATPFIDICPVLILRHHSSVADVWSLSGRAAQLAIVALNGERLVESARSHSLTAV